MCTIRFLKELGAFQAQILEKFELYPNNFYKKNTLMIKTQIQSKGMDVNHFNSD